MKRSRKQRKVTLAVVLPAVADGMTLQMVTDHARKLLREGHPQFREATVRLMSVVETTVYSTERQYEEEEEKGG